MVTVNMYLSPSWRSERKNIANLNFFFSFGLQKIWAWNQNRDPDSEKKPGFESLATVNGHDCPKCIVDLVC